VDRHAEVSVSEYQLAIAAVVDGKAIGVEAAAATLNCSACAQANVLHRNELRTPAEEIKDNEIE